VYDDEQTSCASTPPTMHTDRHRNRSHYIRGHLAGQGQQAACGQRRLHRRVPGRSKASLHTTKH
jgi:hypothetical protein